MRALGYVKLLQYLLWRLLVGNVELKKVWKYSIVEYRRAKRFVCKLVCKFRRTSSKPDEPLVDLSTLRYWITTSEGIDFVAQVNPPP